MKDKLLKVSVALVSIPLVLGVSIFILWLLTKWGILTLAGIFTIEGGLVCVVIGIILLIIYNIVRKKSGLSVALKQNLIVMSIVALNFIVGIFIIYLFLSMVTQYVLVIDNQSTAPIEQIKVYGTGGSSPDYFTIPILKSVQRIRRKIYFRHEGSLEFTAKRKNKLTQGVIECYVTINNGGGAKLVFNEADYKVIDTDRPGK